MVAGADRPLLNVSSQARGWEWGGELGGLAAGGQKA